MKHVLATGPYGLNSVAKLIVNDGYDCKFFWECTLFMAVYCGHRVCLALLVGTSLQLQ